MALHRGLLVAPVAEQALHAHPLSAHAVFVRVRALLSDKFDVPSAEVHPTSRLVLDLSVDPLDLDYFALALEEEFGVDISDLDAARLVTLLDAVQCVLVSDRAR